MYRAANRPKLYRLFAQASDNYPFCCFQVQGDRAWDSTCTAPRESAFGLTGYRSARSVGQLESEEAEEFFGTNEADLANNLIATVEALVVQ